MFNYFVMFNKDKKKWCVWSVGLISKIPKTVPVGDRFGESYLGHVDAIRIAKLRNDEIDVMNTHPMRCNVLTCEYD